MSKGLEALERLNFNPVVKAIVEDDSKALDILKNKLKFEYQCGMVFIDVNEEELFLLQRVKNEKIKQKNQRFRFKRGKRKWQ